MKKIRLLILLVIVLVLVLFLSKQANKVSDNPTPASTPTSAIALTPTPVNITASFEIYTLGTKRTFADGKYHNLSQDVYIEAENPSIVHVKKAGITWDDFFATLPMQLTKNCLVTGTKQTFCSGPEGTLRFFINDVENPDALDEIINEGDSLRVTYGA